jgi:CheY-like chemotaxis protein
MNLPFARALIVDDELHSQMRLQFALEQTGFQCDLARTGHDALQLIEDGRYHVVVTELILPETNGGELVIKLCSLKPSPLVVVHTRSLEHEVYCGLKNEGVHAIFCKPTDYSQMARQIRTLVEGHMTRVDQAPKSETTSTTPGEVVRIFRKGDGWIQDSKARVETFRFTIIILACILFGLGWGNSLDPGIAGVCKMFGLCGFAFYFCLELVAYYRDRHRNRLLQWSTPRDEQLPVMPRHAEAGKSVSLTSSTVKA